MIARVERVDAGPVARVVADQRGRHLVVGAAEGERFEVVALQPNVCLTSEFECRLTRRSRVGVNEAAFEIEDSLPGRRSNSSTPRKPKRCATG